jgi:hypothetical protein
MIVNDQTRFINNKSLTGKRLFILLIVVFYLFINLAFACSISTDKQNYCKGEMVNFNYYVNQECDVNVKLISPSGQNVIHSERATAGNHQFPGQAWEPLGTRTAILEANGAECARTSYNIVDCTQPTCDQSACQSRSGPAGQVTENGVTYQVYNQCSCINNNCQCNPVKTPITPACDQAACQSRSGPAGQVTENGVTYQVTNYCTCVNNNCQCNPVKTPITPACDQAACQSRSGPAGQVIENGVTYQVTNYCTCVNNNCQCNPVKTPITPICDLVDCQSRGGPAGQVIENGVTYQVTNYCTCFNNNCQCNPVKTPITPACDQMACQSRNKPLGPSFERDGYWYEHYQNCECTINGKCECKEIERLTARPQEPKCSGTISGNVKDAKTGSLLSGAVQLICKNGGDCLGSPAPTDSTGFYSTGGKCPSTSYEITCSAEGYKQSTLQVTTDGNGNAQRDFSLEPECQGTISGKVLDASNSQPIPSANLLICQNSKCFDPIERLLSINGIRHYLLCRRLQTSRGYCEYE